MAKARKTPSTGAVQDAAVEYFSSRSHDSWRESFLKANPGEKGKPRMRMRGGAMVDVNQPWSKLDARAKEDNLRAARDAFAAVSKFPNDREAAADFVHKCWIKANKKDPNQPKDLFKPYAQLPENEKDKDRAHVDDMKKAIAAVRKGVAKRTNKPPPSATAKAKRANATLRVEVDASAWARLEAAAKNLSKALGREVSPRLLATAGVEVMTGVCKSLAAEARSKRG